MCRSNDPCVISCLRLGDERCSSLRSIDDFDWWKVSIFKICFHHTLIKKYLELNMLNIFRFIRDGKPKARTLSQAFVLFCFFLFRFVSYLFFDDECVRNPGIIKILESSALDLGGTTTLFSTMARTRLDPTTPEARKAISELHLLRKIKLKKQLAKAKAKLGIKDDPIVPQSINTNVSTSDTRLSSSHDDISCGTSRRDKIKSFDRMHNKTNKSEKDEFTKTAVDTSPPSKNKCKTIIPFTVKKSDPLSKSKEIREKLLKERSDLRKEQERSFLAAKNKREEYLANRARTKNHLGKRSSRGQTCLSNHIDILLSKIQRQ